jgi:DNA-binding LacI/PurR family transcriptional regulator
VSFALNGQPGVSAATRARILAIAGEIGYQPSSAARALTAGKAGAYGLVTAWPGGADGLEPSVARLVAGLQAELARDQVSLLLTMAADTDAEIALYRQWWAQRRVDAVVVTGLRVDDPRIPAIERLRLPAVVVGPSAGAGSLPSVWPDEPAAAAILAGHLAAQGCRRVAHLGGPPGYWPAAARRAAFAAAATAAGLAAFSVTAGPGVEQAARASAALLSLPDPPGAIVCDTSLLAVAALSAAQRAGLRVPGDVAIVSGEDAAVCELTNPALTALRTGDAALGTAAARMLADLAAGGQPASAVADPPALQVRASTGPAGVTPVAAGRRRRRPGRQTPDCLARGRHRPVRGGCGPVVAREDLGFRVGQVVQQLAFRSLAIGPHDRIGDDPVALEVGPVEILG